MNSTEVLGHCSTMPQWLEKGRWEKNLTKIDTSTDANIGKLWQSFFNQLQTSRVWQKENEGWILHIATHFRLNLPPNFRQGNLAAIKLIGVMRQRFLALLEIERLLVATGQSVLSKARDFDKAVEHASRRMLDMSTSLPPVETEEDFSFLVYFQMIEPPKTHLHLFLPKNGGKKSLDEDLRWGASLLQKGNLSREIAPLAVKVLALVIGQRTREKAMSTEARLFGFRCDQTNSCFTKHPSTKKFSSELLPALNHLFALWKQHELALLDGKRSSEVGLPFSVPALYARLHSGRYHERQTHLYKHIAEDSPPTSLDPVDPAKTYGFPWKLRGYEKFTQISLPHFDPNSCQEETSKKIATLIDKEVEEAVNKNKEKVEPLDIEPPMAHPPATLSQIKTAVEWALSDPERDPFQKRETEEVSRWYRSNPSDKHTFSHTFPRRLRNLLAHPALREIFSLKTASGHALIVEVRREQETSGLYGLLKMDWSAQEGTRELSRYMWTALAHARMDLRSLLHIQREQHPPETFRILPNCRIAIWDGESGLWYVIWPSARDVRTLELDFSDFFSIEEGGFWE